MNQLVIKLLYILHNVQGYIDQYQVRYHQMLHRHGHCPYQAMPTHRNDLWQDTLTTAQIWPVSQHLISSFHLITINCIYRASVTEIPIPTCDRATVAKENSVQKPGPGSYGSKGGPSWRGYWPPSWTHHNYGMHFSNSETVLPPLEEPLMNM